MKRIFCGPDVTGAKALKAILEQNTAEQEEQDMKIKSGFILREIVGEYLVMPTGDNIGKYNGTIVLNEVSAFVWKQLQNPICYDDLLKAILEEYDVDAETAKKDLDALLARLQEYDVIDQD